MHQNAPSSLQIAEHESSRGGAREPGWWPAASLCRRLRHSRGSPVISRLQHPSHDRRWAARFLTKNRKMEVRKKCIFCAYCHAIALSHSAIWQRSTPIHVEPRRTQNIEWLCKYRLCAAEQRFASLTSKHIWSKAVMKLHGRDVNFVFIPIP